MRTFFGTCLILLMAGFSHSITLEVPSEQYPTLMAAIQSAEEGDRIILVSNQLRYLAGGINLDFSLSIEGLSTNREEFIIDGSLTPNLYLINTNSNLQLVNLTITGFNSEHSIINTTNNLTINNCFIDRNVSTLGNVIYSSGQVVTINNSKFSWNESELSGGAISADHSQLHISDCQFHYNTSNGEITGTGTAQGGAVYSSYCELVVEDCLFTNNQISEAGGGAIGIHHTNNNFVQHYIARCEFTNNTAHRGGAIDIMGRRVEIGSCQFNENTSEVGGAIFGSLFFLDVLNSKFIMNSAVEQGGAIRLARPCVDGMPPSSYFNINDCQFESNNAHDGGAIYTHSGVYNGSVTDSEFHNNVAGNGFNGRGGAAFIIETDMTIRNCLFVGNHLNANNLVLPSGETIHHAETSSLTMINSTITKSGSIHSTDRVAVCNRDNASFFGHNLNICNNFDSIPLLLPTHEQYQYQLTNTNIINPSWESCYPGDLTCQNAFSVDPAFVSDDDDFRLKWISQLLDMGNPNFAEYDFDRTMPDIGWSPPYVTTELSGTVTELVAGNYLVTGPTTLAGPLVQIPEGVTFKLHGDAALTLGNTGPDPQAYTIRIGDEAGARTAIVHDDLATGMVYMGNNRSDHAASSVILEGVLFNHGSNALVSWQPTLLFENCRLDLEAPRVKFHNYMNSRIDFWSICRGRFSGFDFTNTQIREVNAQGHPIGAGLGWIESYYSDMAIQDVHFNAVASPLYWKVFSQGLAPGARPLLAHCTFDAIYDDAGSTPLYFAEHAPRLHHNLFNAGPRSIVLGNATLDLASGAMNQFIRPVGHPWPSEPVIFGYQSLVDLYCGYNSFIQTQFDASHPRVDAGRASDDWSANFVGWNCSAPLPNPALHMSADEGLVLVGLPQCPGPNEIVPCDGQMAPSVLYDEGMEADAEGNWEAAVAYWSALLVEDPTHFTCTKVSGRIKGIGLATEYGAEHYAFVRQRLDAAAAASQGVNLLLSVYQTCSSWVLEGRHGDRLGALAALDQLLVLYAGNAKALLTINAALAEIRSFPPQGGTSALGPELALARRVERAQHLHEMASVWVRDEVRQLAKTPATEAPAAPATFSLSACWPNPFNPATQVELVLGEGGPARVEVHNMAGQRVRVLHDGPLPLGMSRFVFEAGDLASGLYLITARQGERAAVAKALLVK